MITTNAALVESRSIPVPESGCWIWEGAMNERGYGMLSMGRKGAKRLAHRVSWEATNGPIPEGLFVCHKCDTPICVNPAHLFVGTARDNNLDRKSKGRYIGTWNGRALITESDVREIRDLESAMSQITIGEHYGISQRAVSDICRRKTWTNVE